jgi:FkbM family methyltransferase
MSAGFRRLVATRGMYAGRLDLLKSIYNRVLIKVPNWLPFRGRVVRVALRGQECGIYLRLGTTDFWVLEEIFGEHEYGMVPNDIVPPSGLVIDLGANIGLSVRCWLARWPACRIVAVEPHPGNAELCLLNIQGNFPPEACQVVEACVTSSRGSVTIATTDGDWAHKLLPGTDTQGIKVKAVTMLDVMAGLRGDGVVHLLKCDIEGAEAEVFASCESWIQRIQCMVVEIHPPYSLDLLAADIKRAGGEFEVLYVSAKGELFLACLINRRILS